MNILSIVLPITVVVSGIVIFATKGFEYLIYYVLLLGCFTLFTGLRGIRKKEDDFSKYMNLTILGILLVYSFFF